MTTATNAVDRLTDDVIECITLFLTPRDLLAAMRVSTYWRRICRSDSVWQRLCELRWRLDAPEDVRKACATEDYLELYVYLERNGLVPRGKYTAKHPLVWGKNRQQGADVWVTIAHRSDCRLLSTPSGAAYIQLRMVVQNLKHQPLFVDFQEMKADWKDGQEGRVLGTSNSQLTTLAPRLVALNGDDRNEKLVNHRLTLQFFEFAVVLVNINCGECEFEADFLERCSALWLPIRRPGPCTSLSTCRCALIPDNYHHGSIRVPIVDESVIWKHYRPVSGRFMVLDYRSTPLKYPFAQCHSHKASSKSSALRKSSIS